MAWRHFRVLGLQRARQSVSETRNTFPRRIEGAVSSCRSASQFCASTIQFYLQKRSVSTERPLTGEYHQHIDQYATSANYGKMDNAAALEQFRKHVPKREGRRARSGPETNVIVGDLLHRAPTFSSNELADALALCIKHGFSQHHSLVRCLLSHVPQALEEVSVHSLSIFAWSVAKLKVGDASLMAVLVKKAMDCNWSAMNPQSLSRLMWAFVSLRHLPEPLLAAFLEHIPEYLPKCTTSSLNSLVQCAGMETTAIPNSFVERLIGEVVKRPFSEWLYCTVAWILGRRQQQDIQFYNVMFQRIMEKKASKWTPRLVSTISWSLAASHVYNPDVMDRLAADAIPRLGLFSNRHLAIMVYAYGYLNHPCKALLEAAQALYIERVRGAGAAITEDYTLGLNGLQMVWACIVADTYPRHLVELFTDRQVLARTIETRNVRAANILLQLHIALSIENPWLGLQGLPPDVLESLVAISVWDASQTLESSKFHSYVNQAMVQLTGSARAFQSEGHTRSAYRIDFELLVDQNGEPVMPPEGLWLTSSDLPTMMSTGVVDTSPHVRGRKNNSSEGSVDDVLELLKSAGWTTAKGEVTAYGPHQKSNQESTNLSTLSPVALNTLITNLRQRHSTGQAEGEVVPSSSSSQITQTPALPVVNLASDWSLAFTGGHVEGCHRVAIEPDGPYHFHQSPEGYSLTGSTHLKRRQLAAMGWKVLPLPFHEWHALQSVTEQVEYLRQGLKKLVKLVEDS